MDKLLITHYRFLILSIFLIFIPNSLFAQDWVYIVSKGDNLWNLSEQHLDKVTRFEQVRKLNGISNPKRIKPGTPIRIPLKWVRSNPVAAKVASFNGQVELLKANDSKVISVNADTLLHLGDQLRTLDNSTIAIEFADKSILTVHENSLVHFDHLSAHGVTGMVDSRLNLLQGRMDTRVTPAAGPGSRFEIQTPSAISAVRGTEYRASVSENNTSSNIEVLHGKVAVSGANQNVMVNSGFGTKVTAGSAPIPPRELLPAPIFDSIPTSIQHINWRLSWSPIDSAISYRVEVAKEANFNTVLWQSVTDYNRIAFPDLVDGHYIVRVRAIDKLGLEGHNQITDFSLNAHPQPPIALKPIDKEVFREQSPILQWTMTQEAVSYRLEIAKDTAFTDVVFDESGITQAQFDTAQLSDIGHYYWRLSSIAHDGEQGPLGPVRSYQIKAIPEKVDAALATVDDGLLVASWSKNTHQYRYKVQLANDINFKDLVIDNMISEPTISFEPTSNNARYLRVKSIESDGYEGPWGATQTIEPLPREDDNFWPIVITTIFTIIAF